MTNERKKVGVGWSKTSQDGTKEFVSIVINGGLSPDLNLVMFKNGFKEKDNQPDYIIYLNPPRPVAAGSAAASAAKPAATATAQDFPDDGISDDDIPF
jgi:hypothetical protein